MYGLECPREYYVENLQVINTFALESYNIYGCWSLTSYIMDNIIVNGPVTLSTCIRCWSGDGHWPVSACDSQHYLLKKLFRIGGNFGLRLGEWDEVGGDKGYSNYLLGAIWLNKIFTISWFSKTPYLVFWEGGLALAPVASPLHEPARLHWTPPRG